MEKIVFEEAIQMLARGGIYTALSTDSLLNAIEGGEHIECYKDERCLLIANISEDSVYISIEPIDDNINIEYILDFLSRKYDKISVTLNTHYLSLSNREMIKTIMSKKFTYISQIIDLGYMGRSIKSSSADVPIFALTSVNKEMFCSMNAEQIENRPSLSVLFNAFVQNGAGTILAYFEDGIIKGYLSYMPLRTVNSCNTFDVDYIYVFPKYRNSGIGMKLAQAYLAEVMKKHGTALWSNAKNEISEKVALSTGFEVIGTTFRFQSKNDT